MARFIHPTQTSNAFFSLRRFLTVKIQKSKNQILLNCHTLSAESIIKLCHQTAQSPAIKYFFLRDIRINDDVLDAFIHLVTNNTSIVQYRFHTIPALNPEQNKKLEHAFEQNSTFEVFYPDIKFYELKPFSEFSYRNKITRIVREITKSVKERNWLTFKNLIENHQKIIQSHIHATRPIYSLEFQEDLNWCYHWIQLESINRHNFNNTVCNRRFPPVHVIETSHELPPSSVEPIRLTKEKLAKLCLAYQTQSWLGYFLTIFSFGFYQHHSASIACLLQLLNDSSRQSYSKEEIRDALASTNNHDSQKAHRLSFFETQGACIRSGTDLIIQSIFLEFS